MAGNETIAALLLDIEGTTTPIDFVYQTLFPYARARLTDFLQTRWNFPDMQADITRLKAEYAGEASSLAELPRWNDEAPQASALAYLSWLMDSDRKSPALKSLQGKIWQAGYESGEIKGTVFADVPPFLAAWKQRGGRVYIFSSGSVLAQQLLFRHAEQGDLTPLLDGYFDTTTGPKQHPRSYAAIAEAVCVPATAIAFVSDTLEELAAAEEAGLRPILSLRPGNRPVSTERYPAIRRFTELESLL